MPLRERLRKAFKSGSTSSSKSTSPTIPDAEVRWPSNVYKPGEPMPRPKYRAPVKKEHKEKLEAFNFTTPFRRRSHVSLYSPMGSRLPSRRNSYARPSFDGPRRSLHRPGSRSSSVMSNDLPRGPSYRAAQPPTLSKVESEVDADDGFKTITATTPRIAEGTPLSRSQSVISTKSSIPAKEEANDSKQDSGQLFIDFLTNDSQHKMWSADDLAAALRRNTLTSVGA